MALRRRHPRWWIRRLMEWHIQGLLSSCQHNWCWIFQMGQMLLLTLCMAGTQREREALHFLYFHTTIWVWDATWINWIACSFLYASLGLPPFHVIAAADTWGSFRFLLWFAEVGIKKGTDSTALNLQIVLEKFWKENRVFYVNAALPVLAWIGCTRLERPLKRKVAESFVLQE